jgi:multiple antibiotic resistance protein
MGIIKAILSTTLILFSVIDIIGSLPVILDLRKKGMQVHPGIAALGSGLLMLSFLFFGGALLRIF